MMRRAEALRRGLSAAVFAIGLLGAAGYVLDLPRLVQPLAGWPVQRLSTSLALLVLGLALGVGGSPLPRHRTLARWLAALGALLATMELLEWVVGLELGLDGYAAVLPLAPGDGVPLGRMPLLTAGSLLLAALGVFHLDRPARRGWSWSEVCAAVIIAPAVLAFCDLAYGARLLPAGWSMALGTQVAAVAAGMALVLSRPGHRALELLAADSAPGRAARRLVVVLGPALVGLVGLTAALARLGGLTEAQAAALRSFAGIGLLAAAIGWSLRDLWRSDREARDTRHTLEAARDRLEERITERTRQLQESETRLRVTLDHAEIGLWEWNVAKDTIRFDPNAAALFTVSPDALPTTASALVRRVHPEDRRALSDAVLRHLASPEALFTAEFRLKDGNGRWFWAGFRGRVVARFVDGTPIRMMGTVQDVSARRESEEAVRRQKEDLEQVLHVISHDLREPLRAVTNFSSLVLRDYAASLDGRGADYLQRVNRAASRLDRLILDVAQLARARFKPVDPAPVAMAECVGDALGRLEARIADSGAAVRVDQDLPVLEVDRTWATQAIFNLVLNALKFTRDGVPPEVHIGPWRGAGQAGIAVRDRGPGVPPDRAEHVFGLFHRDVGREVEGTGAGLAIVRQVALRHCGDAWVEPHDGGGAVFVVTFGPEMSEALA